MIENSTVARLAVAWLVGAFTPLELRAQIIVGEFLLGDDVADGAFRVKQVNVFNLIFVAALDGDFLRRNVALLDQILTRILSMDETGQALFLARALHLNQHNRTDVITRALVVFTGDLVQFIALKPGIV